jgi:outer membrane protein assembly factor BamB
MKGNCSSRAGLTPVDAPAAPSVRWSITLPGTTTTSDDFEPYDPSGTVVVTAGSVVALDLASGAKLWDVEPPNTNACLEPAVLGANGAILAAQCDGTHFLARDGK